MKKHMFRLITVICAAALLVALAVSVTYALVTREDTAQNVITAGNLDFEIHEVTKSGETFPVEGVTVFPGDIVSKIVTIENTGRHPMYLRVKLTKDVNDENLTVDERMTMNINTEYWIYKEDGYYYYKDAVESKEETQPIFTEVYIDGETVGNEYIGKTFILNIAGNAVQSENNGATVFDAAGWPADAK